MPRPSARLLLLTLSWLVCVAAPAAAGAPAREVIVDTDIGDDIDDAFAVALLLSSPELRVELITTSLGDTRLRARLLERLLRAAGRTGIAVAVGPSTLPQTRFTQSDWASAEPSRAFKDAVGATLDRLRAAPAGRFTLVALAPMVSIGAMIDRDPAAFRRLAGVVMMGGSIRRGYGPQAGTTSTAPSAEFNVRCDPAGLRKLLASGVPVTMLPLDATEIALDAAARARLFAAPGRLAPVLSSLYRQWAANNAWGTTPTLFDVVPVARLLQPSICRPVRLHLDVTDAGRTLVTAGPPNVAACLDIDRAAVLRLIEARLGSARILGGPRSFAGPLRDPH